MATQTIQFNSVSLSEIGSGAITAFIYDGTTQVAALSTVTEDATLKGQYTGTVTDEAADTYRLVVKFDGITISEPEYQVTLAAPTATYIASMDVATQATADAILVDTGTTIPDKLLGYVQLLARSDMYVLSDRAAELAEINADEGSGGGSYSNLSHSLYALDSDLSNMNSAVSNTYTAVNALPALFPANFATLSITTGDIAGTVGGIAGTINTLDELDTALDTAHGDGSWEDAGGGGDDAETIYNYFTSGSNEDVFKATGIGSTEITVVASGPGIEGDTLSLKRGSRQVLVVTLLSTPAFTDVFLGIRDSAGRNLLRSKAVLAGLDATFTITSKEAMNLSAGTHQYDLFTVDGYDSETGTYTDAQVIATADVVVEEIHLHLGPYK